jgi:hypothetical protein
MPWQSGGLGAHLVDRRTQTVVAFNGGVLGLVFLPEDGTLEEVAFEQGDNALVDEGPAECLDGIAHMEQLSHEHLEDSGGVKKDIGLCGIGDSLFGTGAKLIEMRERFGELLLIKSIEGFMKIAKTEGIVEIGEAKSVDTEFIEKRC